MLHVTEHSSHDITTNKYTYARIKPPWESNTKQKTPTRITSPSSPSSAQVWAWWTVSTTIYIALSNANIIITAINSLLPSPVPIYHLGLFRERTTLQPVEYYNNLPYSRASTTSSTEEPINTAAAELAILVDPVIATGATAEAAIHLLREWGAKRVLVISVLGTEPGVRRAA